MSINTVWGLSAIGIVWIIAIGLVYISMVKDGKKDG